jgi:hypothetical protein
LHNGKVNTGCLHSLFVVFFHFPAMRKLVKKIFRKAGLPSETLLYTGERKDEKITVHVADYDETDFHESELTAVEQCMKEMVVTFRAS